MSNLGAILLVGGEIMSGGFGENLNKFRKKFKLSQTELKELKEFLFFHFFLFFHIPKTMLYQANKE